jgi:acetyl-CoA C-acetyltransferase
MRPQPGLHPSRRGLTAAPQDEDWHTHSPSRRAEYLGACQGSPDRSKKLQEEETPAENELTIKGKAYIAGIYEHPTRHAPDKSTAQLHAEVAKGAIEDAGLTKADIDGYFCAGDAPGGSGRWSTISA